MSLEGLSKEEAFMHGWEQATQRAISRAELGLPLDRPSTDAELARLNVEQRLVKRSAFAPYFEQAKITGD